MQHLTINIKATNRSRDCRYAQSHQFKWTSVK